LKTDQGKLAMFLSHTGEIALLEFRDRTSFHFLSMCIINFSFYLFDGLGNFYFFALLRRAI